MSTMNDQTILPPLEGATVIDRSFCQHLAVMLRSLAVNHQSARPIRFWVLASDVEEDPRQRLAASLKEFPFLTIEWKSIDPALYDGLFIHLHLSIATYFRFQLPDLIPPTVHRVLFLDSDLVVLKSLEELWATDLGEAGLAAVRDLGVGDVRRLGFARGEPYFNAGVLLIDLDRWRQLDVLARAMGMAREYGSRLEWMDQDILNLLFRGHWKELDPAWNVQTAFYTSVYKVKEPWRSALRQAIRQPRIVHFTGPSKPWEFRNLHPLRHLYWHYRRDSGWGDKAPGAPGWMARLTRALRACLPVWVRWKLTILAEAAWRRRG
ncbi:MAG: Glycosyl transferase, family 8 [Candidatus Ozemobacter sibiricus]|jgi:lipopolysaccharide biosynthesis glycosyltransferase|uniref:Glycosyl transferase, family 8 n=1 Tax=Candidatus Ozemobacter sibiricus TaxID=2268124 RepID=A0A367ZKD7_9BACT|nr:MAG: Glycosyl transferase, family 8 [Candidatus Ozemobacter sibiricus]